MYVASPAIIFLWVNIPHNITSSLSALKSHTFCDYGYVLVWNFSLWLQPRDQTSFWEKKEVTWSKIWRVWGFGSDICVVVDEKLARCQCTVSRHVIMLENTVAITQMFRLFVPNVLPETPQNITVVRRLNSLTLWKGEKHHECQLCSWLCSWPGAPYFSWGLQTLSLWKQLFGLWVVALSVFFPWWWSLTWSLGHVGKDAGDSDADALLWSLEMQMHMYHWSHTQMLQKKLLQVRKNILACTCYKHITVQFSVQAQQ